MGELSGLPILAVAVLLLVSGCYGPKNEIEQPPEPVLDGSVLSFTGQRCSVAVAETTADRAAIQAKLPTGFTATEAVAGRGTVTVNLFECRSGQVGNLSLPLEELLNFWFIEALVTPPSWAPSDKPTSFVLGFYTEDPLILRSFPAINVTTSAGKATPTANGGSGQSDDGAVTIDAVQKATPFEEGRDRIRFLALNNGTIAGWEGREVPRSQAVVGAFRVTADAGSLWGELAGPVAVATGFVSFPPSGDPDFKFGPGFVYWAGPPGNGTA